MADLAFGIGALAWVTQFWFGKISKIVPDPHLDEVFHIPQAQAYCQGRWDIWDPKLTTPPGLYMISYFFGHTFFLNCTVTFLRSQNAIVNCVLIPYVTYRISRCLHRAAGVPSSDSFLARYAAWTAINVALFPVLFFFSALYYTDNAATFCVLLTYLLFLERRIPQSSFNLADHPVVKDLAIIISGLVSLSFRQTNIFWVAIFLGALELVRTVEGSDENSPDLAMDVSYVDILDQAWNRGCVYDLSCADASIGDYLKTTLSLAITTLVKLPRLLSALTPYLILLIAFILFILWNGGVVLGDKSNHIATIHLPQLLYLHPFLLFFSPFVIAPYISSFLFAQSSLPAFLRIATPSIPLSDIRPRPITILASLALALVAIQSNTIIHPFTLADNRHYTFYIFRRILNHRPYTRYILAPSYILIGWSVIRTLGGPVPDLSNVASHPPQQQQGNTKAIHRSVAIASSRNSKVSPKKVSWVLVYLSTVAACLGTVPLWEPRYLILPWVIWRLNLPIPSSPSSSSPSHAQRAYTLLALETLWFLTINLTTGWIFLYQPFTWPSEPGKLQRFMW